jgi:large subunit ribosomal protein L22
MQVKATAKFIRISPRKTRLVVGLIRNLNVEIAQEQLKAMPKAASDDVLKVLNSAIANAIHNKKAKKEDLVVSEAFVDGGPTLKRWRARAFGRAAQIRKRTSHITVVVSDKLAKKEDKKDKKVQIKKGETQNIAPVKDKKEKKEKKTENKKDKKVEKKKVEKKEEKSKF